MRPRFTRRPLHASLAALALAACGEKAGTCTPLVEGEWTIEGDAMGMPMGANVANDGCTFTFSDWSMEMISLPTGGTIDGLVITMEGDAHWSSCTAALAEDGASAEGTCDDDGTSFTMVVGALTTPS